MIIIISPLMLNFDVRHGEKPCGEASEENPLKTQKDPDKQTLPIPALKTEYKKGELTSPP
ncbi:hypothetical protein CEF21_06605 [Bacillus sp. FJAT-42376]|nr:hypothetical protein CEF21_06605 [Bacillus sp. FJAT-42376]